VIPTTALDAFKNIYDIIPYTDGATVWRSAGWMRIPEITDIIEENPLEFDVTIYMRAFV